MRAPRYVGLVLSDFQARGYGPWWCGHTHRTGVAAQTCAEREARRQHARGTPGHLQAIARSDRRVEAGEVPS